MTEQKKTPAVGETAGGKSKNNIESGTTLTERANPDNCDVLSHYGAPPGDWTHFDLILGLTEDLLPVVSNPNAVKSPSSKIQTPGKTPTQYDKRRQFTGFSGWTKRKATAADITKWMKEPDYGICLITRYVRAIDADISHFDEATDVEAFIDAHLGFKLPRRRRGNSSKFAMLFTLPGEMPKRRFKTKTEGNFIEMLGSGQQIIVAGTHTSGVRYEWEGGLPDSIPELTAEQFESLWTALEAKFASEKSVTVRAGKPDRDMTRNINGAPDPVVDYLYEMGLVTAVTASGDICVDCPEKHGHSADNGPSETVWQPAGTNGYAQGHFDCKHSSCKSIISSDRDYLEAIGYLAHGFEVVEVTDEEYNRVAPQAAALIERAKTVPTPVDLDSLFSDLILTDKDVAAMADAEFLVENLIVSGSLHAFVAPANGGKTTLFIHLCEELAARGLKIFYINADANPADLKRQFVHAQQHGYVVIAPDAKLGMGPKDIVERFQQMNKTGADLRDVVIVLDTLKKFSNMIDKKQMRAFLALMRGLSTKGATICMLAHTNKRTEENGQHIFEGTGDLRNDVDNLIYLEGEKIPTEGKQTITTRPDKVRANFKPASWQIDLESRQVSRADGVLPVMGDDARMVLDLAKQAINNGATKQGTLVDFIKTQSTLGDRKIRETLSSLTIKHGRPLAIRKGENNANLYSIADALDGFAVEGDETIH